MPEVKIVFVLVYWLFCVVLVWTNFSVSDARADIAENSFQNYAGCMAGGSRKNHSCHMLRLQLEDISIPELDALYRILVSFLNFVSLPFVIEFHTIKNFVRQAARKLKFNSKTA